MTSFKHISLLIAFYLFSGAVSMSYAQQAEQIVKTELAVVNQISGIDQNEPYKSQFFRVRGTPKVTVHTTTGDVEVFQNPDIDGVKVDLFLERSFSLWSGRRSLDNYRIILQQQGDHIIASVENRNSGHAPSSDDTKFHFLVQTPEEVNTNLRTFNGDITLDNVVGSHFIQNQTGDIRINHTRGEVRVVSTTGNINLENSEGHMYAKTVSGTVNIQSNYGEVRVRSVAGDINASNITGTLVSATTSGNIFADFVSVSNGIYLETVSGNIELFLPESRGFDIKGSAMSFDLRGLNESNITQRNQNQRDLNVVIREGGLPVNLSTMSGRIRVSESQ